MRKVKIKTWKRMAKEFGEDITDDIQYIKCKKSFTREMENLLPKDRIISITDKDNHMEWDTSDDIFDISDDMIDSLKDKKIKTKHKKKIKELERKLKIANSTVAGQIEHIRDLEKKQQWIKSLYRSTSKTPRNSRKSYREKRQTVLWFKICISR